MKRRYRKTDIDRHSNDGYGAMYPAINVKVQRIACTTEDIIAKFPGCSEEQAQKALEFAFTLEQESFWEYWQDTTGDVENGLTGDPQYAYFPGEKVMVYSVGRSGGWLIVQGLPPVEEWNAVMVNRWAKFEKAVLKDIEYKVGKESMLGDIGANEWWKERSSQYNFYTANGKNVCLADVRADVSSYADDKYGMTLEELV